MLKAAKVDVGTVETENICYLGEMVTIAGIKLARIERAELLK